MDKHSKIAILGFGAEGKAMFEYLHGHGFPNLTICDQDVNLKEKLPNGVSASLGKDYLQDLEDFDVIFRSPGIRWLEPQIQVALKNGVEVTSVTAFFMDQCPCEVIGVTGTKGKGTTCTLIHKILEKSGKSSYLGGNIGEPPVNFLDDLKRDDVVVLELSSFQLQDLGKSPHYAVLLNTTSDHLDYHADRDEYVAAKEAILAHQGEDSLAVLNKDYEYAGQYKSLVKGKLRYVSVKEKVDGAYVKGEKIFYNDEEIMSVEDVKLIGSHNLENVLPAVVIAKELGAETEDLAAVVKEFGGLPHRLELVREFEAVSYYNDSFSTTPETSMAAVDSFEVPTVLIAGGFDKKLDYTDWALKIMTKPNLETVILIGDVAEQMEAALRDAHEKLGEAEGSETLVIRKDSFEAAIDAARDAAKPTGVVILSPATASFDMFPNYKVRGKEFAEYVMKLSA